MSTWTSKLGTKYMKDEIVKNEKQTKQELDRLRQLTENRTCADCGCQPTVWASVNLGIFLCIRCGSIHRGIGTHISKPKGLTGTYLWGPDEVENMKLIGNARCEQIYGGESSRPSPNASDSEWRTFILNKYEGRKFAPIVTASCMKEEVELNIDNSPSPSMNKVQKNGKSDAIDLMSFDTVVDVKNKKKSNKATVDTKLTISSNDFFAEFGV